jgi:trehalose utilization protein
MRSTLPATQVGLREETMMSIDPIRVTVWGENVAEQEDPRVRAIYPDGLHGAIASGIARQLGEAVSVRTATFDHPEHGLTDEVLATTDVLTWWGHRVHDRVADEVVARVQQHALNGMGLIVLHSGHESKIFTRLMGTTCALLWREADDRELVWTVNPSHPIAEGIPSPLVIPAQEMYGEFFDIPQPDELIFISTFTGGEVFRSGCCFRRGYGRIFYFGPGHETYPVYHQAEVHRILANAVRWTHSGSRARQTRYTPVNSPAGWIDRNQGAS